MAVWLSNSALISISKFALHWAHFLLELVDGCAYVYPQEDVRGPWPTPKPVTLKFFGVFSKLLRMLFVH